MLRLHRAERADRLVDALADVLADPPEDPFAREYVAVHAKGIERWLQQELSLRLGTGRGAKATDGVAANIQFPFPAKLVNRALAAAEDIDPDEDPWVPSKLVWPLLEVLDTVGHEPWLSPLRWHVAADGDEDPLRRSRRYPAARHIADLFDRYAIHRPEMIRSWHQEHDTDGAGQSLEGTDVWQPMLWRLLRDRLAIPSPAERLIDAIGRLRSGDVDESKLDLPQRMSLFGLTALPSSYVTVLTTLAEHRDIHLFLLHPSGALWDAVAADLRRSGTVPRRRDADATRETAHNQLLASWGRDAREMQLVLAAAGAEGGDHRPPPHEPATLLQHIQSDVWANREVRSVRSDAADDRPVLDGQDHSLQVHACHGRTRQVEVLRDAVLHLLADDAELEPRDILVMCPDIEAYAPLISAVFGAAAVTAEGARDDDGPPNLRVKLADRAIRQTNPVLRVMSEVLNLADGRMTASEVLALAGRDPVRRRFRFDDDALEQIERWIIAARIRWGLDGEHRARFGLGSVTSNTWRSGLDRILLGVAMPDIDDRVIGGTVPLDDVGEQVLPVAGRLAELIDRLDTVFGLFAHVQPIAAWQESLLRAAELLTATTEHDDWQTVQLQRILSDVVTEATHDGVVSDVGLSLPEVRSLLEERLKGRPTRASHRTGDLTVCTLVPMRSVPHKVICLLGMDDGMFPRRTVADGDDLIDRDPHVGDRDARTEDRQLLLDALLAATQTLLITYTGRDERTNERRPPAVPVGELLDVIDRTVTTGEEGVAARTRVVVEHPLQPFDRRNYEPQRLGGRERWSFDRVGLSGAQALSQPAQRPGLFIDPPLEPSGETEIHLDEVVKFVEHPVRVFLRRRLNIWVSEESNDASDAMPVELDALENYAVGDRLLRARLDGTDADRWATAERLRGTLPPGRLADNAITDATEVVEAVLAKAGESVDLTAGRAALEINLDLGSGRSLLGTVPDVIGDTVVTLQYSRVRPKQRLAAWVRVLAATAMHPDRPLRGLVVGRCRDSKKKVTWAVVEPLGDTADERRKVALDLLDDVLRLYDEGLCEPLPLYCRTSGFWAAADHEGADGEDVARKSWFTSWEIPNEDRDAAHVLVLGGIAPFEDIFTDRFCQVARRLWTPLLDRETVDDC
jgi:exodeoxyribonuclease V gamma subunit